MQRTLKALLICVLLTGIVLAISVGLQRPRTDDVVRLFLGEFSKPDGEPRRFIHQYDLGGISLERMSETVRRYNHQLGTFKAVEEVLESRRISKDLKEVLVRVRFEKATASVRARIRDDGRSRGIANFEIDAPTNLERPPTLRSLERAVGIKPFEAFAQGETASLYSYLGWDLHNEIDVKTWSERYLDLHLEMGELQTTRAVTDYDEMDQAVYERTYEATFEKGRYVFEIEWSFHDFFWTITKFKLDVQMNG